MGCSILFAILYRFPERNLTTHSLLNISEICLRNQTTDPLGMVSLKTDTVLTLLRLDYHKQQATGRYLKIISKNKYA